MTVRAATLAFMVVVLSRLLGASDYGKFITVAAIPSFLTPFAGLGLSLVLLRHGARNPQQLDLLLASALRTWIWSTLTCMTLGIFIGLLLLTRDLPRLATLALIVSEIASVSLVDLLARAEQARHQPVRFGLINAGLPMARLIALLFFWTFSQRTLCGWMWTYAGSGIIYALAVYACLGPYERMNADTPRLGIREGLPLGLSSFALRLQAEFNKPLLARTGFDNAAYMGVAQRVVDLASLPLSALQETLWPHLYADHDGRTRLRKVAIALVVFGLLIGTALWFLAGFVPQLIGHSFTESVPVIRWLAWLPVLQLLRNFSYYGAVNANRTDIVGISYAVGALVAVIMMVTTIQSFGLHGAIASAYIGEMTIIVTQRIMLDACKRRHPPPGRSAL